MLHTRFTPVVALFALGFAAPPAPARPVPVQEQEAGQDVKAEFEKRKAATSETDAAALFDLAMWAEANGLKTDSKRVLRQVIKVDKDHAEARQLLGYVKYEDKWVTESEMKRLEKKKEEEEKLAQGLRKWDGEWYPAEEVEKFEQGLVKVEVDGQVQWVTKRDKERMDKGLVPYKGQWVTKDEKDKIDQGLFRVEVEGQVKWLTEAEADEFHASLQTPWEIEGEFATLVTTCNYAFGNKALGQAKKAIEQAYSVLGLPVPQEFPKITLMLVQTIDDYNAIGGGAQDEADAAMSSSYGCFSMQNPETGQYVGVIHFSVLDESNPAANENYTSFLIRHAACEAALRGLRLKEELPRWFITGVATYLERYWDPFNADGVRKLGQWSADSLNREGGLMKLGSFFEPFQITRQTLLQSGLLVSYLLHGSPPEPVRQQWDAVKASLVSPDNKGLAKEFLKFESLLGQDAEATLSEYMASLTG